MLAMPISIAPTNRSFLLFVVYTLFLRLYLLLGVSSFNTSQTISKQHSVHLKYTYAILRDPDTLSLVIYVVMLSVFFISINSTGVHSLSGSYCICSIGVENDAVILCCASTNLKNSGFYSILAYALLGKRLLSNQQLIYSTDMI